MVNVDDFFSVIALFIIFRETIEASIIVSVLLQFCNRSFPQLKRQVWWGCGAGVVVSILFGIIFSVLYYVAKENLFAGKNRALFKGIVAWVAAFLITILAFAMMRYKGWETKIKRKLTEKAKKTHLADKVIEEAQKNSTEEAAIDASVSKGFATAKTSSSGSRDFSDPDAPAAVDVQIAPVPSQDVENSSSDEEAKEVPNNQLVLPARHRYAIFLLIFTTVVREGIESVVFLAGVGNAKPTALILPGFIGLVSGILVGVFLYYSGKTVKDLRYFIITMAVVLLFISAGQVSLGTDSLMVAGVFGELSPWMDERPWKFVPLWDLSRCCSDLDVENKFLAVVRAIFGYQDKPTPVEAFFYCGYWVLVLMITAYKWWNGSLYDADYKYTKQMAKERKMLEKQLEEAAALDMEAQAAAKLAESAKQPSNTNAVAVA